MTDQPVGDLIKSITDDVKQLVRDEVALAKAELIPAAKNGGIGGGLFAGAGYFAICALSVLYFAAGFGLAELFDWGVWLGLLVVGIALLLLAGILGGIGYLFVKRVKAPEKTIAQANQTIEEVKGAAQQALAAASAPQIEGEVVRDQKALR
jgi:membrane protein implicated in regulation of membrane protease activity